jgi:hypothetical protein
MTYAEKLLLPEWGAKRQKILERDGFACRDCGAKDRPLEVHHCWYRGEPWDTPDALLLTVCDTHHRERQAIEDAAHRHIAAFCATTSLVDLRTLFPPTTSAEVCHGR